MNKKRKNVKFAYGAVLLTVVFLSLLFSRGNKGYNVILISIDTLRADHLGVYGYHRDTSPNIDALAKDSIVFENAISQASWTLPSHVSIFTSKYPPEIYPYNLSANMSDDYMASLARKEFVAHPNIATVLKGNGYSTVAFTSGGYVAGRLGFENGFDIYDDSYMQIKNPAPQITSRAIEWLEANRTNKFFLFLHYFDVHCPYEPLPEFQKFYLESQSRFNLSLRCAELDFSKLRFSNDEEAANSSDVNRIIGGYDDSITQVDYYLGEFIDKLKGYGIYDNTIIVILSDHGETLYNHTGSDYFSDDFPTGYAGHGFSLFNEVLRVPLIIKYPGSSHQIVQERVGIVDVLPTVLDILKMDAPFNFSGKSALNIERDRNLIAVSGRVKDFPYGGYAVFNDSHKMIFKERKDGTNATFLYDLGTDGNEVSNLGSVKPDISGKLKDWLFYTLNVMVQNVAVKGHEDAAGTRIVDMEDILQNLAQQGYFGA
ncbi:MAG: sulfatase [Candidatus Aenigmarchaeota archaeon]|nr:sulfatase [Candidatus Aenigmarchaeota archaeon]